jgi:metallo-beta-lactamase family protein
VAFGAAFTPAPGFAARLFPSGHILGASIVQVQAGGRRLVYSGDLGRYDVPVLRDPDAVAGADTLLVESTYGNRRHPPDDGTPVIEDALQGAVSRGGVVLIPAFAVGRTQELLYLIRQLEEQGRVPRLDVYLDSPMGTAATAIYTRHPEEHDADTTRLAAAGRPPFTPSRFRVVSTVAESKRLNELPGPAVIVAGSGMATGGRILHHLRHRLSDARTTVLFVGYQAAGTRGRQLRDGATRLRVFGEELPVRARILATDALSAHADQGELLRWLRGFRQPPGATWAVHGEPDAARSLIETVGRELGWPDCGVAADGARVEI